MADRLILGCMLVTGLLDCAYAAKAPTWDDCNCRFNPWNDWSDCTSSCFGQRERSRSVTLTQYPNCDAFEDCATPDEGWDFQGCNEVCENGGTKLSSSCSCVTGYTGITCGTPDNIQNGAVTYPNKYYGATATYSCNQHYTLTDGSDVRTCQISSVWSGTKPRCAYIQPPVMIGCLEDHTVNATETLHHYTWTVPTFTDPLGNELQVVGNYPSPEFRFPWGDHTVQYVATKPSNGLQTECKFEIRIRPTPCDDHNVPANGALICNNFKTDYGRFCLVACESTFTINPTLYDYENIYVCGASGQWIAAGPSPDCEIQMADTADIIDAQQSYSDYSYNPSCTDVESKTHLQNLYIDTITDNFREFCSEFSDECLPENILVKCE